MKKSGYYSSGEFARMAHVTLRTIRYYDKQDILKPSLVAESGARFYTDADFARLQQILLLKYLGFSLEDIRQMTIDDSDYHFMLNSLHIQLKLVKDRIEQMQLVEKAIQDTAEVIQKEHNIDWSQMLNLIHLTSMENSLKNQYQNASNISARINLHSLYSQNPQGWFPWICEHSGRTTFRGFLIMSISYCPISLKGCCAMPEGRSVQRIHAFLLMPLTATISPLRITAWIS